MIRVKSNLAKVASRLQRLSRQAVKTATNKAIAEARRAAVTVIRGHYKLPAHGQKEMDQDTKRYGLPAIASQINVTKIEAVGGIDAGVTARLLSSTKPISLIRFMRGTPPAIKPQRGILVQRRQRYTGKIGSRPARIGAGFVAQVKKTGVRQLFRRMRGKFNPKTKKEKMAKQALPSVYVVLSRADNFQRLRDVAVQTFRAVMTKAMREKFKSKP